MRYRLAMPGLLWGLITAACGAPAPSDGPMDQALKTMQQARALLDEGKPAQALPLMQSACRILKDAGGDNSLTLAIAIENLAYVHRAVGEPGNAVPLYQQSARIRRQLQGDGSEDLAAVLRSLGAAQCEIPDYPAAMLTYEQALAVFQKLHPKPHRDVATAWSNLSFAQAHGAQYERALDSARKAATLANTLFEPGSPQLAPILNNLAAIYYQTGEFDQAEPLMKQVLDLESRAYGPAHPELATALNNLAGLYQSIGQFAKAEPLYQRCIEIRRKVSPRSPALASSLLNLASLYRDMRRDSEVRPLCDEALTLQKALARPAQSEIARALNMLGDLHYRQGDFKEAARLFEQAVSLRESTLGKDHLAVASSLNNLANVHDALGEHDQAKANLLRALRISTRVYGAKHPRLLPLLDNLLANAVARGARDEALKWARSAHALTEKQVDVILAFADESTKLNYLKLVSGNLDLQLCLAARVLPDNGDAVQLAAEAALRSKNLTLESLAARQELLAAGNDPQLRRLAEQSRQTLREVARLTYARASAADSTQVDQQLHALEQQKELLEAELTRRSSRFVRQRASRSATVASVCAALPAGGALIELTRSNTFDFALKGKSDCWMPPRYLAFVIHRCAGGGGGVRLVDLGDAVTIDTAVAEYRQAVSSTRTAVRGLDTAPLEQQDRAGAAEKLRACTARLYQLVFKPIEPLLSECDRLILAPDGPLAAIPFEALQGAGGRYLIENYSISYIGCGRDVLRYTDAIPRSRLNDAVIFADPDFGAFDARTSTAPATAAADAPLRDVNPADLQFSPLPGTAEEAQRVAAVLQARSECTFSGPNATRSALLAVKSPGVLHIATHGFFLRDLRESPSASRAGAGARSTPSSGNLETANPLLRSGLALAGANRWRSGQDQGLLTALEVSGMNLRDTDLVTLSACETGLGSIQRGEGVFGLRRAFMEAGARSLLTSLWKVPDQETAAIMESIYSQWKTGAGKSEALRQAQLDMIQAGRKSRDGKDHPFYWAGFILIGDWR